MTNLKAYLEYEKDNSLPRQEDFSHVLNKITVENKNIEKYVYTENQILTKLIPSRFIPSPFVSMGFGAICLSLAIFSFIFNNSNQKNSNPVALIQKEDVELIKQKRENAVQIINSINSFNNN